MSNYILKEAYTPKAFLFNEKTQLFNSLKIYLNKLFQFLFYIKMNEKT